MPNRLSLQFGLKSSRSFLVSKVYTIRQNSRIPKITHAISSLRMVKSLHFIAGRFSVLNDINALVFLGLLGRFAVLVILPPLEKNSTQLFSGPGLTDKHQLTIHIVSNPNSTVTLYLSFCVGSN